MRKIQQVSKGMVILLTLALIAVLLIVSFLLLYPEISIKQFHSAYNLSPNLLPLSAWQYVGMALLAVLNVSPTLFVIWKLRKMFQLFAAGNIFTSAATKHLFSAAKGMVVWGIIAIVSTTAAVLILTAQAEKGEHMFTVSVSSGQLAGIFAGFIFVVISWVMQEAARLSEENAGFV